MRTVEEVRRLRLQKLVDEFGSLADVSERIGLNRRDSTLSQYLNQSKNSKTGTAKVMGSGTARKLEAGCNKEVGWMDTDPEAFQDTEFSPGALTLARQLDRLKTAEERGEAETAALAAILEVMQRNEIPPKKTPPPSGRPETPPEPSQPPARVQARKPAKARTGHEGQ